MIDTHKGVRISNVQPSPDTILVDIADYVCDSAIDSANAYDAARLCFMDALGCGLAALAHPACTKLLGPIVPGTIVPHGARVPGTAFQLDPVLAAFNIGAMVRWLDFNDTWLAMEWGHPSDNLASILATADWLCRRAVANQKRPLVMRDVLTAMIKAYEIQGCLALQNAFNRVGLDHVVLVKVASAAVVTRMLGGTKTEVIDAVSQAWIDGQSLRTYRHAPNTGSRKSWAAGDAASRAVRLALMTLTGETGYPSALTAETWGFYDALFRGQAFTLARPYGSYVIEHVLFKVHFPAEFHAQTAVEAAIQLHQQIKGRIGEIASVVIMTTEAAMRIIDKQGPLHNPADRDHCIQYMTAVALLKGALTAADYENPVAADPLIDELRGKIVCIEDPRYSVEYLDPEKRSIGNSVQVFFFDGSQTPRVEVEYPLGHRRRRSEGLPHLRQKFSRNLLSRFSEKRAAAILALCDDEAELLGTPVHEVVDLFVP
jgi:2-methylcitrate dehydratase